MDQPFKIDPSASIGSVVLKVKDLEKVSRYYQLIGLNVLEQSAESVSLGVAGTDKPLLVLVRIQHTRERKTAGLFHTAFLLPTRKDLGDTLYRLLVKKVPLSGASDHGYSEALYLEDPEGNGVEIYCDKPKSEWDIREDGRIAGITVEMDADGVLASREPTRLIEKFPENTTIGHIHLSICDLDETQVFYQQIGFDLTDQFGEQARFFSAGGYHHHIGANSWMGKNLPRMTQEETGLKTFTILLSNKENISKIKQNIQICGITILEDTNEALSILDPNGLEIVFKLRG